MKTNRNRTSGTSQLGVEVDAELLTRFRAVAADRGDTLRVAVERALRLYLGEPEPDTVPVRKRGRRPKNASE
ncbi:MAG: hypothetical protein LC104_03195 [Bacteroidales bacterium]|nr:hypothetical protein [Bacteroidales bacterium]